MCVCVTLDCSLLYPTSSLTLCQFITPFPLPLCQSLFPSLSLSRSPPSLLLPLLPLSFSLSSSLYLPLSLSPSLSLSSSLSLSLSLSLSSPLVFPSLHLAIFGRKAPCSNKQVMCVH